MLQRFYWKLSHQKYNSPFLSDETKMKLWVGWWIFNSGVHHWQSTLPPEKSVFLTGVLTGWRFYLQVLCSCLKPVWLVIVWIQTLLVCEAKSLRWIVSPSMSHGNNRRFPQSPSWPEIAGVSISSKWICYCVPLQLSNVGRADKLAAREFNLATYPWDLELIWEFFDPHFYLTLERDQLFNVSFRIGHQMALSWPLYI